MTRAAGVVGSLVVIAIVFAGYLYLWPRGSASDDSWTRSPNFTTCVQWLSEMKPSQRTAMAGQLLPILRSQVDTAADGGAALVGRFSGDISAACVSKEVAADPTYVVTAAATLAFFDDTGVQP